MWSRQSWHDEHVLSSTYFFIVTLLLVVSFFLQHWTKNVAKLNIPEAIVPIVVGLTVSAAINFCGGYDKSSRYSEERGSVSAMGSLANFDASIIELDNGTFFFAFLPPMIFNSGYHLKRRLLYDNMDAIFSLAFVGTMMSLLLVAGILAQLQNMGLMLTEDPLSGMELIAFGSLISSTDPISALAVFGNLRVDPQLFYLILGEALLNDAIAVTVYKSASKFISVDKLQVYSVASTIFTDFIITLFLSALLGYAFGLFFSWVMKHCVSLAVHSLLSVSLICLLAWLPFFLSEALQLSGIVAVLFTGIAARRYVTKNIGRVPALRASFVVSLASHLAETSTFLLLGLSVLSQNFQTMHWGFVLYSLLATTLARACHVYPLLGLVNLKRWIRAVKSSGSKAASVDGYAYGELHSSVEAPVPASMQDSSTDRADRVDTEASVEDTTRDASECGAGKTRIRIVTSSPQHFHHIQKDSPAMIRSRSSRSIIAVSKETADTSTSCNNIAPGCIVNLFGTRSRSRSDACDPSGAGLRSDNGGEGGSSYELIPLRNMHVTFISGLRGAVSFACATVFSEERGHRSMIIGCTSMLILVTLFLQGSLTEPLIRWLKIPIDVPAVDAGGEVQRRKRGPKDWDLEETYCYPLLLRSWNTTTISSETSWTSPVAPTDAKGCCCFDSAITAVICGSPMLQPSLPTAMETVLSGASVVSVSSGGGSINHEFGIDAMFSSPWRSPICKGKYFTPTQSRHHEVCCEARSHASSTWLTSKDNTSARSRTTNTDSESESESDADASKSLVTSTSSHCDHNTDSPNPNLEVLEDTSPYIRFPFSRVGYMDTQLYNHKERLRIPKVQTEHNTLVGAFLHPFEPHHFHTTLEEEDEEEEEEEEDDAQSFYTPTGSARDTSDFGY